MESHLESGSTGDLHSTKSAMLRPRNFLKDYYHQGESSHGEISKVTKSTEQTNSRYSKDDSWAPLTAKEKELDQLKYELPQLKAILEKNEAELQHLSEDRNKILAQHDELMNMVKQKEALTLKGELDEFQKALKPLEDGLLDRDPVKRNLEKSKEFLQKLGSRGINTQELEGSLQSISSQIEEVDNYVKKDQKLKEILPFIESIKQKYQKSSAGISDNTLKIENNRTYQIKDVNDLSRFKNEMDSIYDVIGNIRNKLTNKNFSKKDKIQAIQRAPEEATGYSKLNYAVCEYLLSSAYRDFKDFSTKVQSEIEGQICKIDKKTKNQRINKLDEDINRVIETIIGPKQEKKKKQGTRIEQTKSALQEKLEDLECKIRANQHKNDNLKKKIQQLDLPIAEYKRYNPKASKAESEEYRDNLAQRYNQEGFEGVKNALSILTETTDARSND